MSGIVAFTPISLGKALSILSSCSKREFVEGLLGGAQPNDSPVAHSLRSVDFHISKCKTEKDIVSIFRNIILPVIDKIVSFKKEEQREPLYRLSEYMYQTYQEHVSNVLQWLLLGGDFQEEKQRKKYQLGSCLVAKYVLQHTVNEINDWQSPKDPLQSSSKKKSRISQEHNAEPEVVITDSPAEHHPGIVALDQMVQFSPAILLKAEKTSQLHSISEYLIGLALKGCVYEGLACLPTRLGIVANDCYWTLLHTLAVCCKLLSMENLKQYLLSQTENILSSLTQMLKWYQDVRPLFATGLKKILTNVTYANEISKRNHESAMNDSAELLLYICHVYAPYVIEENPHRLKNIYKEILSLLSQIPDPNSPQYFELEEQSRQQLDFHSRTNLLILVLIIGLLKPKSQQEVMDHVAQHMHGVLTRQLHSKDEEIQELSIKLLQLMIGMNDSGEKGTGNKDFVELMVEPLLELLSAKDATSKAVVAFIAKYASMWPQKILPEVFRNVDSTSNTQRKNALDILSEILTINRTTFDNQTQDASSKALSMKLTEFLLGHLHDEELTLRTQAAKLFEILEPGYIIPKLAKLVYHRDGRVRSAADQALVQILNSKTNVVDTISVLLDCIREGAALKQTSPEATQVAILSPAHIGVTAPTSPTPRTPAELANMVSHFTDSNTQQTTSTKADANEDNRAELDLFDRVIRVIPQWAKEVPEAVWPSLVGVILGKLFAFPSDGTIVKFISKISPQLTDHHHLVFTAVSQRMSSQPRLTEELLESSSPESADQVKELLFERLRPLLVLRVFHSSCFRIHLPGNGHSQLTKELADLLFERMVDVYEFDEVRKLSSEIFGRIEPSEYSTHKAITKLIELVSKQDYYMSKVVLFSLCNNIVLHTSWLQNSEEPLYQQYVADINSLLPVVLPKLNIPPQANAPEFTKFQQGVMELLSLLLPFSLPIPGEAPKTQHPEDFHQILAFAMDTVLTTVNSLTALVTSPDSPPLNPSLCLFSINIIITTIKRASIIQVQQLAVIVIPSLLSTVSSSKMKNAHSPILLTVLSAIIQLLFTLAYHLKAHLVPFLSDLFPFSLDAIGHPDHSIKMNGLKLLGALLSTIGDTNSPLDEVTLSHLVQLLRSVANIDPAPEARQLAEKYLQSLGQ